MKEEEEEESAARPLTPPWRRPRPYELRSQPLLKQDAGLQQATAGGEQNQRSWLKPSSFDDPGFVSQGGAASPLGVGFPFGAGGAPQQAVGFSIWDDEVAAAGPYSEELLGGSRAIGLKKDIRALESENARLREQLAQTKEKISREVVGRVTAEKRREAARSEVERLKRGVLLSKRQIQASDKDLERIQERTPPDYLIHPRTSVVVPVFEPPPEQPSDALRDEINDLKRMREDAEAIGESPAAPPAPRAPGTTTADSDGRPSEGTTTDAEEGALESSVLPPARRSPREQSTGAIPPDLGYFPGREHAKAKVKAGPPPVLASARPSDHRLFIQR